MCRCKHVSLCGSWIRRRGIISICTYVWPLVSNSASALPLFPWSEETLRLLLCRQMQQIFQHTKQMNIWLWYNRVDHSGHWPPGGCVGVWCTAGVSRVGEWNSKDKLRTWESGWPVDSFSFIFENTQIFFYSLAHNYSQAGRQYGYGKYRYIVLGYSFLSSCFISGWGSISHGETDTIDYCLVNMSSALKFWLIIGFLFIVLLSCSQKWSPTSVVRSLAHGSSLYTFTLANISVFCEQRRTRRGRFGSGESLWGAAQDLESAEK